MLVLVAIGFLAGVITSISPCILPVLPVVLAAGVGRPQTNDAALAPSPPTPVRRFHVRSWRPYAVVAGLVISFSTATLFGSVVLSALGLPQDLLLTLALRSWSSLALDSFFVLWGSFSSDRSSW